MKQRQERRWKARAELSARREARVEELRQEPGAEVPESEEDFRQRMQRNFLEGDTLQTKLAIVEEISKERRDVERGLEACARDDWAVDSDSVDAAMKSGDPKIALISLIVEKRVAETETPASHVGRLLLEAGPDTNEANALRARLESRAAPDGTRMDSGAHVQNLQKVALDSGVSTQLITAAGHCGEEVKALVALVVEAEILPHETPRQHVERLLNEASRRTNKDDSDVLRVELAKLNVRAPAEVMMDFEEELDEEEAAMFADERAKLDVLLFKAGDAGRELESREQFHVRTGKLYNPKTGDRLLPLLASQYAEDTAKALAKLAAKRQMRRNIVHERLLDLHARRLRLLPWATVTANTNDKLVVTSGSTGPRSTLALVETSGKHAQQLFGREPKLTNGLAARTPLPREERQPFAAISMAARKCFKIDLAPVDQWGHTPLHLAARWRQKEATQLLLNAGALIDAHGKRYADGLFLRGNDAVALAEEVRQICLIQRHWRYRSYQRWYTSWKASVVVIQNRWRFRSARREWFERRAAVVSMQALWRGFKGRKKVQLVRQAQAAPKLQLHWAQFCKTTGRDHVCMLYRMGECPFRTGGNCLNHQVPEWEEGGEQTLRQALKENHVPMPVLRTRRHGPLEPAEWRKLVETAKTAGISLPMIDAFGAKHGGLNEPKRTEVLHFLKKPEVQPYLDLCGDLIAAMDGPGMCFRKAADPDGKRVGQGKGGGFVSSHLFFSGSEMDAELIRKNLSKLDGFVDDPVKFRMTEDRAALIAYFESEEAAAAAMDFLQSAPKSKGGMPFGGATSVVYGKQAKAPQSKTQPQALFLELDEDGSGYLDRDEVDQLMKRMGKWLSAKEIDRCMAELDADGNDEVSLEEFEDWWRSNGNKFTAAEDKELTEMVEADGRAALKSVGDKRPLHVVPDEELRSLGGSNWSNKAGRFSTGRSAEALKLRWEQISGGPPKKASRLEQMMAAKQKANAAFAEQIREAAIREKEEAEAEEQRKADLAAREQAVELGKKAVQAELATVERKKNLDKLRELNRCVVGDTRALSDEAYAMAVSLVQRTTVAEPLLDPDAPPPDALAASQAARKLIANESLATDSLVDAS